MLESMRLPGAMALASLPTRPKPLATPGFMEKSSISSFSSTPVPGGTKPDPNHWLMESVAATRLPDNRPGTEVLVMPALNAMFDIATVRVMATQMHPPGIVFAMLIGLALASALLAGYQGADDNGHLRSGVHKLGFAAIIAFTVYVIIDIEYPRMGWIRIDAVDQVLVNTRAGMK